MKTRLAITMMLVLGLMASGTGATLAISGPSDDGASASAVYPDADVQGQEQGANPSETLAGTEESAPTSQSGNSGSSAPQDSEQRVATGSDTSLPFTGFAAIPLLVLGLGMLGGGLVLGRRARKG